jgi:hypothetical protein
MTIKEQEVEKKANELLSISLGANFSTPREKEVAQYWAARNIVDEVISVLEQIPKLTVCEIEGQKCYGIIDFYKDVKLKIQEVR